MLVGVGPRLWVEPVGNRPIFSQHLETTLHTGLEKLLKLSEPVSSTHMGLGTAASRRRQTMAERPPSLALHACGESGWKNSQPGCHPSSRLPGTAFPSSGQSSGWRCCFLGQARPSSHPRGHWAEAPEGSWRLLQQLLVSVLPSKAGLVLTWPLAWPAHGLPGPRDKPGAGGGILFLTPLAFS